MSNNSFFDIDRANYRCRAGNLIDVFDFVGSCFEALSSTDPADDDCAYCDIVQIRVTKAGDHDKVELWIESNMTLQAIKNIMNSSAGLRVMMQTLNFTDAYTGERRFTDGHFADGR